LFRYGGNGKGCDNLDPQLEPELKNRFLDINNNRCEIPLPASEVNQIWKDSVAYYTKKKKEKTDVDDDQKESASDTDQEEESTALRVLRLAEDQCDELFHDQFNAPYAAIPECVRYLVAR
jgi:galactokinase/mevalonate kinase-like predicted kinase